jgi:hypothetical protein
VAPERSHVQEPPARGREAIQQTKEWKHAGLPLLEKLASLDNQDFWQKQRDTLAVFASPDSFHWWLFGETMPLLVAVVVSF